jgi:hypothetical protein
MAVFTYTNGLKCFKSLFVSSEQYALTILYWTENGGIFIYRLKYWLYIERSNDKKGKKRISTFFNYKHWKQRESNIKI